uniref:Uncharacterized protein n=2 Tax=Physcomitrium patens TaxID=3218 RepID=A0A2K1LBT4_PHYPA|nr:hypothetical protein PHYPA_001909 [Physcomitrium patens]
MVLLHVKQKDDRQFLFEASAKASVDSVVRELVVVNNLQVRILGLQEEVKWLALYGPAKHPDDDEDSDDESQNGKKIRGPHYSKDPHCRRTGEACDPEVSKQITNTMADAVALVSKIIVKLRAQGSGCPEREPPIDADTHKAMMAHYFKQQEQLKRMAEDEDDAYMNAQWANPKALKSQLHGMAANMHFK